MPRSSVCCNDFRRTSISRRTFLTAGALGTVGLSLARFLEATAAPAARARRAAARSCILLHQFGGPSHLATFHPNPSAPANVRGAFATIPTTTPGVRLGEHLPRLAALFERFALVRSVSHRTSSHNSAGYYSLTGHQPLIDIV